MKPQGRLIVVYQLNIKKKKQCCVYIDYYIKTSWWGVPWWHSGQDSGLSLTWPRINLWSGNRSHRLHGMAKQTNRTKQTNKQPPCTKTQKSIIDIQAEKKKESKQHQRQYSNHKRGEQKWKGRKKTYKNKSKILNKMAIRTYILIITLTVNRLNAPNKRHTS